MILASKMPHSMKLRGRPRRNTYPPVVISSKDFHQNEPKRRRRGSVDSGPLHNLDITYDALRPICPNVIKERKVSHRRKDSEATPLLSKTGILKFIPLGRRHPQKAFDNEDPIDHLIRKMQENFNIIDTVQKVPVRVHIPEVYHLSMASFCEDFFERRETLDTVSYRNGFQASALVKSGALDSAHLQDCDLDNPIHPIFQEDNWTDTPAHIYQTIQPALKLATKFLTTPYCMQYWLTLLRGNREYCTFTSAIYKVPRNRIFRDIPNTPELARATMDDLISLAPTVDLQFHNLSGELYAKANGHNCHTSQTRLYTDKSHATPYVKPHIHIHTDFYTAAQKISETRFPDRAQVLRYSLFLAVLLVHELAHVVEMTRQPPGQVGRREDFIYGHPIAEAGRAWEVQLLGGVLEPINVRCDGLSGLAIKDWPACRGLVDLSSPAEGREFRTVSMEYVGRYFRKDFWKDIERLPLDTVGALHIPRDGIYGVGAPMCSTAKEKEFEDSNVKGKEERVQSVLRDILQEGVKVGVHSGIGARGRSRVSRKRKNIGLGCSRRLIRARC